MKKQFFANLKEAFSLFFKKCQIFLPFFTFFIFLAPFSRADLSPSIGASQLSDPPSDSADIQGFTCGYRALVEYVNSLIVFEQELVLDLIDQWVVGVLPPEDKQKMVEILIRYRFLPINKVGESCRFYSFLCSQKANKEVSALALKFRQNNPAGPQFCYISAGGREQKAPLMSDTCVLAIKKRIRAVPFPLALAQAGLESGWGTSYFARQGYNFFGLQTVLPSASSKGDKCVRARQNTRNCVYKFDSPESSFFIYSQVLNSSRAYIRLREWRYRSWQAGDSVCETALKMTQGLSAYAKDPSYQQKVRSAIHKICRLVNNC